MTCWVLPSGPTKETEGVRNKAGHTVIGGIGPIIVEALKEKIIWPSKPRQIFDRPLFTLTYKPCISCDPNVTL